ncbi:class I SAM-dependent methyltransferase [Tsukamurella sp. 1534]|uniref:class I SAM-dependent methyltransferase n=1 Tax=Tsukamurella sp. 1534 TaxID=1151061 RepID=UPI00030DD2BD|nr:class I SAM-dependent methyltransferase [Tsukamurella sp. 1534]
MKPVAPEDTAVRTALWRALHAELDSPAVLTDTVGLALLAPDAGWRDRGDMDPSFSRGMRAWVAARSRIVEDLVLETRADQYVLLGAGLDTFAQRHPGAAATVFEVDEPGPQEWKRARLADLGLLDPRQRFVPVDFETDDGWVAHLAATGFDGDRPAVVASLGVSMYLSREATEGVLRSVAAGFAPGAVLVMTYQPPTELLTGADRRAREVSMRGAARNGNPFVSFYTPDEAVQCALACGLRDARTISTAETTARYFADRADGLVPSHGEEMLVATV